MKRIEEVLDKEFYDYLCNKVAGCVKESQIEDVSKCRHIVMLGSNLPDAFYKTLLSLKKCNNNIKITLISTEKQKNRLPVEMNLVSDWVEWNGIYSSYIYDILKDKDYFDEIDGFLYLGRTAINMRDINIYNICMEIDKKHPIRVFMRDYNDLNVVEYINLRLFCAGFDLYNSMNEFINIMKSAEH